MLQYSYQATFKPKGENMTDKKEKKGIFGLFGGQDKKEEEKAEVVVDKIQEAKERTEKMKKETAAKANAMAAQRKKDELAVKKHVVAAGDTLSAISKKYYDDANQYMKIYEANKDVIGSDPNMIKPGQELVIPKL